MIRTTQNIIALLSVFFIAGCVPMSDTSNGNGNGLSAQQRQTAQAHIRANIGDISPEEPVLGGTFMVTDIRWEDENTVIVDYEDGHIALTIRADIKVDAQGSVTVKNVSLIEEDGEEEDEDGEGITIEQTFDGKIVYSSEEETESLREDCQKRGGTFDECGDPCEPGAEICMTVCAYTCTLESSGMQTYTDEDRGFTIRHRVEATVEETDEIPGEEGVRFTFFGPDQTSNTEIFDGYRVTVTRGMYGATLEEFVDAQLESSLEIGEIDSPLREVTLAGRGGFAYAVETQGVISHYYIPLEGRDYLHITTIIRDPTETGYETRVQLMLDSLVLL